MHEYAIVQALLAQVEQEARARNALAVRRLAVRIGELSGVEPELFASAWEVCRDRSVCDGAELVVERVPAQWVCPVCATSIARGAVLSCPACGASARLAHGDELVLERIELEVP